MPSTIKFALTTESGNVPSVRHGAQSLVDPSVDRTREAS
tara:strand:+ start:501 stop:617 length:117 start_codon:yes stop_codon:yes gene_type:complete